MASPERSSPAHATRSSTPPALASALQSRRRRSRAPDARHEAAERVRSHRQCQIPCGHREVHPCGQQHGPPRPRGLPRCRTRAVASRGSASSDASSAITNRRPASTRVHRPGLRRSQTSISVRGDAMAGDEQCRARVRSRRARSRPAWPPAPPKLVQRAAQAFSQRDPPFLGLRSVGR